MAASAPHPDTVSSRPTGADAKWAAVLDDRLIPLPRRRLPARAILAQAGNPQGTLLRDLNEPDDVPLAPDAIVDLAEGNVFRVACGVDASCPPRVTSAAAKLAFIVDDAWEVTTNGRQTAASLRDLFGLPPDAALLRDFESPHDQPIGEDDEIHFADGPVFRLGSCVLTILVNTKPVQLTRRRLTARALKEAAIAQGVTIEIDFVLYRILPDGSLSAAIPDDEHLTLKCGDQFSCVSADDNS